MTRYDDLCKEEKALFLRLVDKGAVERPANKIPCSFFDVEYVRYEDVLYKVVKTDTGRDVVKTHLSVEQVPESAVSDGELIAYDDLTAAAKNAFDESLEKGRYTVRGEGLPNQLHEHKFVFYRSDYYQLWATIADMRVWRLSVSKAADE